MNSDCPFSHTPGQKYRISKDDNIKVSSEDIKTVKPSEVYAKVIKITKESKELICTAKLFPSSFALLTNNCKKEYVTENGEIKVPLSALSYVPTLPRHLIEESKSLNTPTVEHIVNTAVSVISDFASAPVVETATIPASFPAADLVIELLKNIPHTTLEEVVKNPRVGENLENALGVPEQVQAFQEHIQALQEELSRQSENFHRQSEEFLQHSEQVRYQLEQQLEHQSTQMYHQQALIEHQQSVIQNQAVEMDNLVSYSGGEGSDYLVPEVEVEAEAVSSCLDYNSNGYCCYGVNCRNGPHP